MGSEMCIRDRLKRLVIHENVSVATLVEKLHIGLVDLGFFERIVALESPVKRRAAQKIFQLANEERVPFTRLLELHAGHDVGFAIDLNFESLFEIACFVGHGRSRSGSVGLIWYKSAIQVSFAQTAIASKWKF